MSLQPQRTYRNHLDLACETLSDENAALRDELRETQIDRDSYRAMSQEALHALADIAITVNSQRARIRGLVDELYDLRAATMTRAA
jgi:hypothetical protein